VPSRYRQPPCGNLPFCIAAATSQLREPGVAAAENLGGCQDSISEQQRITGTFLPLAHLLVFPSFVKPPPQEELIPAMFTSPAQHCALQSLELPLPLLSPRHWQLFGAVLDGQQIGFP
jgi:hypothetical protein